MKWATLFVRTLHNKFYWKKNWGLYFLRHILFFYAFENFMKICAEKLHYFTEMTIVVE